MQIPQKPLFLLLALAPLLALTLPEPGSSGPNVHLPTFAPTSPITEFQGQDAKQDGAKPVQGKVPTDIPKTDKGCLTAKCHEGLDEGLFVHGPVAVKKCSLCHEQPAKGKHAFKAMLKASDLCTKCHEMEMEDVIHKPVQDGMCTACHNPHHSQNKSLLKTRRVKDLCVQCHDKVKGMDKKFVHGPVAAGACNLCHQPHSSRNLHLLNKKGSANCTGCHEEMDHKLRSAKYTHRPVSEDCAKCHDPHASDHAFQLKMEKQALCLDCHKAKKEEIEGATVFHEAMTTAEGCANCHNTHASKFPKLLNKPVMQLCFECHKEEQKRPDGSVVKAIGNLIENSKFKHGPIKQGDCSSCHNPHGSKNFRILRKPYPKKFYAPFKKETYGLCFNCHDSKVFTTSETVSLTNFRNGSKNLHFIHVNQKTKGRTCRACHETHASNLPKHMATNVPFGAWEIPIDFKKLPTGGSCAPGCHKPRAYDTIKAVKQLETKETGK